MSSHSISLLSFKSCVPSHKISFDFSPTILGIFFLELSQLSVLLFYAIATHCNVPNFLFLVCCGVMQGSNYFFLVRCCAILPSSFIMQCGANNFASSQAM
jgi:hypothetical protein